jgi:hypothetical protein
MIPCPRSWAISFSVSKASSPGGCWRHGWRPFVSGDARATLRVSLRTARLSSVNHSPRLASRTVMMCQRLGQSIGGVLRVRQKGKMAIDVLAGASLEGHARQPIAHPRHRRDLANIAVRMPSAPGSKLGHRLFSAPPLPGRGHMPHEPAGAAHEPPQRAVDVGSFTNVGGLAARARRDPAGLRGCGFSDDQLHWLARAERTRGCRARGTQRRRGPLPRG